MLRGLRIKQKFGMETNDELVWIDLSTQIIDEIGVKGRRYCYQMGIYKESLLCIGGIKN
jgi:hypothetical protein